MKPGKTSKPQKIKPPVISSPALLPFEDLGWEQFEAFCCELISLLPSFENCRRHGVQGDKQQGIDLVATHIDGKVWAFQCRKVKEFTENQARATVQEATFSAENFVLLLRRAATTTLRNYFDTVPNWELWDAQDICQKVRKLPLEKSKGLIGTHFGGEWRRAFLTPGFTTSLVTAETFFQQLLNQTHLFHHNWAIVGREKTLEQFKNALASNQVRIIVFPGRGGLGKTRILRAIEQEDQITEPTRDWRFAILQPALNAESLEDLLGLNLVLVIDDAHSREDIGIALEFIRRQAPTAKLILSTRPQALQRLNGLLSRTEFDRSEITYIDELTEFVRSDMRSLVHEVFGDTATQYEEGVVSAAGGNPLVALVGAQLVARGEIAPGLLERHADFRFSVLNRFEDATLKDVYERIPKERCHQILQVIAALTPVRLDYPELARIASSFLGINENDWHSALGILEEAGILIRRGKLLRIVPDPLSDHILHSACLTPQGQPTGFANRIFETFSEVSAESLLRNLSELDWRIEAERNQSSSLLNHVWDSIENEFRSVPNSGRIYIFSILAKIAYFQPHRVFALIEYAIQNPTTTPEKEINHYYQPTQQGVLEKIPPMLRDIAYNIEFLPRCCELLWQFGQDDSRPTNSFPDHPFRILTELAGYQHQRPVRYAEMVQDFVARILNEADVHEHKHSPLDLVDPVFAKEGHNTHSEGHSFVMRPYFVNAENTRPLRNKALELVAKVAALGIPRLQIRALQSYGHALRSPTPILGMEITDKMREDFVIDELAALERIIELAQDPSISPIVILHIEETLNWHAAYAHSEEVRQKSLAIIKGFSDTPEKRITATIAFPQRDDPLWQIEPDETWDERCRIKHHKAALEFLEQYPNPNVGLAALERAVTHLTECGVDPQPGFLLGAITREQPKYAAIFAAQIISRGSELLKGCLASIVIPLRNAHQKNAISLAKTALETNEKTLGLSVARIYSWNHVTGGYLSEDRAIVHDLLNHADLDVRREALEALRAFLSAHPEEGTALAFNLEIGSDSQFGRKFVELFNKSYGVLHDTLTDSDLEAALNKLLEVNSIDDYRIKKFIAIVAERIPFATARFLLSRVEHSETSESEYQPLPVLKFDTRLVGIGQSVHTKAILREVRDRTLTLERKDTARYWHMPMLFREASLNFNDAGVSVLEEWVDTEDILKLEVVGDLLRDAPNNFVFTHLEFTRKLLEVAHKLGHEVEQHISTNLYISATTGSKSTTAGEPFPEDIYARDQAKAVLENFDFLSPARKFYESLVKSAEHAIQDTLDRDAEMFVD